MSIQTIQLIKSIVAKLPSKGSKISFALLTKHMCGNIILKVEYFFRHLEKGDKQMEKNLKATKDEALKQSFAEIKKAAVADTAADKKAPAKAATVKAPEKKAEPKAAEKKPAEKKAAEKKPVEKKAVEKKTAAKPAAKSAPAKKAPVEKKAAEKKPVEKKTAAKPQEVSSVISLEINEQQYDLAKLQAEAIEKAKKIKASVEKVDIYVNVAESAAYFTIDGEGNSDYRINL